MKKILIFAVFVLCSAISITVLAQNKQKGEKCFADTECAFDLKCNDGVCVKKKEFDFGGSSKSGKPCSIDADCINAGKCVDNGFGKKYCSGN